MRFIHFKRFCPNLLKMKLYYFGLFIISFITLGISCVVFLLISIIRFSSNPDSINSLIKIKLLDIIRNLEIVWNCFPFIVLFIYLRSEERRVGYVSRFVLVLIR